MSYLVIPVYSFVCELVDRHQCSAEFECTPANMGRPGEPLLQVAQRLVRAEGWEVRRKRSPVFGQTWEHYCPKHRRAPRVTRESR